MRMIRRTFCRHGVATTVTLAAGTAFAQGKEVKIGYALAINSHYGDRQHRLGRRRGKARTVPTSSSSSRHPRWAANAS